MALQRKPAAAKSAAAMRKGVRTVMKAKRVRGLGRWKDMKDHPERPEMLPHHSWHLCLGPKGLADTRALVAKHPRKTPLQRKQWPPGVMPLPRSTRPFWLPNNFAFGVKTTCRTPLRAYISPWKKMYYHRDVIEQILGQQLGPGESVESAIAWARTQLEAGKGWRTPFEFPDDAKLFQLLSPAERKHLPDVEELRFCVISARRAGNRDTLPRITNVEAQLRAAGAQPVWYVDEASLKDYQAVGLRAVRGGKLCEARNKALADAARAGCACVQISDDISKWTYWTQKRSAKDFTEGNAWSRRLRLRLTVSPVAAARFLLAQMRAVPGPSRPRLAGVHPTANAGMALATRAVVRHHFILGDFFVHDLSPCRFDTALRLKEDYDFTCSHLQRHGAVLRNNRMLLSVLHEVNDGGACSLRDAQGEREREAISTLQEKWPGVFRKNGFRGEDKDKQVVMTWRKARS